MNLEKKLGNVFFFFNDEKSVQWEENVGDGINKIALDNGEKVQ